MDNITQEFRKLKALNKPVRGNEEWKEGTVVVLSPLSWDSDFNNSLIVASRHRVLGETKGCMGVVKVADSPSWAICHLDTGTIVKQVKTEDQSVAKKEADRYGQIFESLNDPILTLKNVQDVIKQSLEIDSIIEESPDSLQLTLN